MRGTGPKPREDSEDAALLQKQGDAHEAAHLARLKSAGRTVIEIERSGLGNNAEATRAAVLSTCRPAAVRRRGAFSWRYAAMPSSAISRHATIASERSAR
jgi:hypothetical protein